MWWTVPAPGDARSGRRLVVREVAAALLAADLPAGLVAAAEAEHVASSALAARRVARVRAHAVEPLERVLGGDVGRCRDERRVGGRRRPRARARALGVGEQQRAVAPRSMRDAFVGEARSQ